jgi:hypothetical protein
MSKIWTVGGGMLATALAMLTMCLSASAITYSPVDLPGPALSVPTATLASALSCHGDLASSPYEPVLLAPVDVLTPFEFSFNWEPALQKLNWPYCTIALPDAGMADMQISGEYLVYAIRTMHALAHKKIGIVGHSMGAILARWALRFWPDTRPMVDDLIGIAPPDHGAGSSALLCPLTKCPASYWQERTGSAWMNALNSGEETFPGISYTDIYTDTDEIIPGDIGPEASSALHGGGGQITNVTIQQVCPTDLDEHHLILLVDNTSYQIAMDALTHAGPADPARVPRSVCLNPLMPGVDLATLPEDLAQISEIFIKNNPFTSYPQLTAEPPLACYVTATCPITKQRAPKHSRRHRHGQHESPRRPARSRG